MPRGITPGVALEATGAAFLVAAVIAILNAVVPPILAALRLPFMLAVGFLLVLFADAALLLLADAVLEGDIHVDSFGSAFLASLVISAASVVLQTILGTDDEDEYSLKVIRRIAKRQGAIARTEGRTRDHLSRDRRPGAAGAARRDARRVRAGHGELDRGRRLPARRRRPTSRRRPEPAQAGILLGSNEDICAFRWVEKETGLMLVCSSPADCAEIERRRGTGVGLLIDGGASRGNLLSGEAEEVILTVQPDRGREEGEPWVPGVPGERLQRHACAGASSCAEIVLELTAAARAKRRDVRPRGHRGGIYPLHARGPVRGRP